MSKKKDVAAPPAKREDAALPTLCEHSFELAPLSEGAGEIFTEEMEGLGTIPFDIIKIPSGGGLAFELPGETDDAPIPANEVTGLIVDHYPVNAYWDTPYDGSNNPPSCSSFDGKEGYDTQTGEVKDCANCPLNQFGSDPNGGNGKACKNMHRIYILLSGQPVPMVLTLPPTSLASWRNYLGKKVVVRGKRPWMVLTKITLKREKSSGGVPYSQAVFTKVCDLTPSECEAIKPLAESFKVITRGEASRSVDSITEGFTKVSEDEDIPFGE